MPFTRRGPTLRPWAILGAAWAAAGLFGAAAAEDSDVVRNQCRAVCGEAWIQAQACTPVAGQFEPPSPRICKRKAQKQYDQCLAACAVMEPDSPAARRLSGWGQGPDSTPAAPWVDAELEWLVLPGRLAAPRPALFQMPARAFAYGAATESLGRRALGQPAFLRIDLEAVSGRVGVLLVSEDGATQLSPERVVTPAQGRATAYFQLGPTLGPAIVVLRNPGDAGKAGSALVHAAQLARESSLSPQELARVRREARPDEVKASAPTP